MFLPAQDLNKLAVGVWTFNTLDSELFMMRAYAPFGCADLPATATAHTGAKAPGARKGCRTCPIEGIRIIGTCTKPLSSSYPSSRLPSPHVRLQ